ncbi:MAG: NfeD family protein [Lachnospiraceae bacterium]|nr:NfeD family protein [Lachnospiraceae bacterium]
MELLHGEPFYWLVLLAVFLVIEIITLGLTTIWLAGGALVGFLASLVHVPLIGQIVLFLIVSIILIVFTRPVAERYFNNSREKTNVGGLIGREGKVITAIDNFNQTGSVLIGGVEWTARSDTEDDTIEEGKRVVVRRVEGVRVFVAEVEK